MERRGARISSVDVFLREDGQKRLLALDWDVSCLGESHRHHFAAGVYYTLLFLAPSRFSCLAVLCCLMIVEARHSPIVFQCHVIYAHESPA